MRGVWKETRGRRVEMAWVGEGGDLLMMTSRLQRVRVRARVIARGYIRECVER